MDILSCAEGIDYEVYILAKAVHIFCFSTEMNIYPINIKTIVTRHHDSYGCQVKK